MAVNKEGVPTSYECVINEYQRRMLAKLVNHAMTAYEPHLRSEPGDTADSMFEEARLMEDMLNDLPEHELSSPGVTHGLCL
jgi:hypothetical protein